MAKEIETKARIKKAVQAYNHKKEQKERDEKQKTKVQVLKERRRNEELQEESFKKVKQEANESVDRITGGQNSTGPG